MKRALIAVLPLALLLCEPCTQRAVAEGSDSTESQSRFVGLDSTGSGTPDATIAVTIQSILSTHAPGAPAGTLISVLNPDAPLLISVGPCLTQEELQSLVGGARLQVTGKMLTVLGRNYFFARGLVVNGRKIAIRNDNGSLVRHLTHSRANSQSSTDGGLQ